MDFTVTPDMTASGMFLGAGTLAPRDGNARVHALVSSPLNGRRDMHCLCGGLSMRSMSAPRDPQLVMLPAVITCTYCIHAAIVLVAVTERVAGGSPVADKVTLLRHEAVLQENASLRRQLREGEESWERKRRSMGSEISRLGAELERLSQPGQAPAKAARDPQLFWRRLAGVLAWRTGQVTLSPLEVAAIASVDVAVRADDAGGLVVVPSARVTSAALVQALEAAGVIQS